MALPLLAGAAAPLLAQLLRWFFLANMAALVTRLLTVIGVSLVTNEYVVQPAIDLVQGNMSGVPSELTVWLDLFGIDNVISIVATAYTIQSVKRVFLGKRA